MSKQIQAKRRMPKSLGYNSYVSTRFSGFFGVGSQFQIPLGLNQKFTHLTYTTVGTMNVGLSQILNVVEGYVQASPAVNTSYGFVDLGGTFLPGDRIILTLAGHTYTHTVTTREPSLALVAAGIVAQLNYDATFNASFIANSLGPEFVLQPNVYDTSTPTYSVSVVSASGTAVAGGIAFVAGTGGPNPYTQPVSDTTDIGIVPSLTAVDGNALFPVDIILPTFNATQANLTGSIYAYKNFDVIWPANEALSIVSSTTHAVSDGIIPVLYGVIVDNHTMTPEDTDGIFKLSPFNL